MAISLRPARPEDRRDIHRWLARSDATAEMIGPPRFPDNPVPDFDAFCADYGDGFFTDGGDGRFYVIELDGRGIGAISYWIRERVAEIDLWIGARGDWGQGHGSAAIRLVAAMLFEGGRVDALIIRPSARNKRAVAAYCKTGFAPCARGHPGLPGWVFREGLDYDDAVVLVWPKP